MSADLSQLFPNCSADFLRLNGFANIPPPRQEAHSCVGGVQKTRDLPSPLAITRPEPLDDSGVTLSLPYPPSANDYWRTRVITPKGGGKPMAITYVTNEARAYKKAVNLIALRFFREPIQGPVYFAMTIFRPRRIGDLSNRLKVLEDALEGAAFVNDKQIEEEHLFRRDDPANPRVEVTIRPL